MKLNWWYLAPFLMAVVNTPFLDHTLNAISMGFCLGTGMTMLMNYYITRSVK